MLQRLRDALRAIPRKRWPVLLFPVRLETRFRNNELLVRIYPDQILVNTHEPRLTRNELDHGLRYRKASTSNSEEGRQDAWRELSRLFGPERAAWIARTVASHKDHTEIETREESWITVPEVMGLPNQFVLFAYQGDKLIPPVPGRPIRNRLTLLADPSSGQEGFIDDNSKWMVDFERAEEQGMGIRVDLLKNEIDIDKVFSRIIVVGLRRASPSASRQNLETIIDSHHYSTGLGFLEPGTPTNNTETEQSGHSETTEDHEGSYQTEIIGPPRWDAPEGRPGRNAQRLGVALGLGSQPESLRYLAHSESGHDVYAEDMKTALWPATGDYLLRYLLPGVVDDDSLKKLARHFTRYVRGGSPLPTLRVGDQPYGILPATCVREESENTPLGWRASELDNPNSDGSEAFDARIHSILSRLFEKWLVWAQDHRRVPRVNVTDDPDKELLQILAMEPVSVSYHTRPFVDERFIAWMLLSLRHYVFGPGTPYGDNGETNSPFYWVLRWAQEWKAQRRAAATQWGEISGASPEKIERAPLLRLLAWWDGNNLDSPLVQSIRDEGSDSPIEYLKALCNQTESNSETVLYDLLKRSLDLAPESSIHPTDVRDAICRLATSTVLDFFNAVTEADQIVKKIMDDPDFSIGPPRAYGVRKTLANRILAVRDGLEGGRFTSIEQIDAIYGVGKDTLHDILFSFRKQDLKPDIDRLFRETLDLCTHRLDGWITSFAAKRLQAMRESEPTGVYLGAYGYVENLKKSTNDLETDGYIHAPSTAHSAAAAVLRNAYLTHSNGNPENPFRVNLNSERVRRALHVVEGVRQGQPLGALLGFRFERSLHDHDLHLEKYIDDFRSDFPIVANKEIAPFPEDSTETVAARNVVDGLALARGWRKIRGGEANGDLQDTILGRLSDHEGALQQELNRLLDVLDGVEDLMTAEGVFHAVQGNFDRAGAALEATSGNGHLPEIDIARTPVSGPLLSHRICLLLGEPEAAMNGSPRASTEPRVANWFKRLVGEDDIRCRYSFPSGGAKVAGELSLADLHLGAVDLLYLSAVPPGGGETQIEQRIAYEVRKREDVPPGARIAIDLSRPGELDYGLGEALELARQTLNLLGAGSYLKPGSLCLPAEADEISFTLADLTILKQRSSDAHAKLDGLKTQLSAAVGDGSVGSANPAQIVKALLEASLFGIPGAIPAGPDAPDLVARGEQVLVAIDRRLTASLKFQEEVPDLQDVPTWEEAPGPEDLGRWVASFVAAMKAVFGRDFVVLPTFVLDTTAPSDGVPSKNDSLALAFERYEPPAGVNEDRVRLWLQQAAQVHSPLRQLEDVLMLSDAWRKPAATSEGSALNLRVAQLSNSSQIGWLGLDKNERGPDPNADEASDRGVLSLVAAAGPNSLPSPSANGGPVRRLGGLLLHQWEEMLPNESVDTSVAFQFNAPNSQAPQSLLLAVPSQREDEMSPWKHEDLAAIVKDTMDLAKVRLVDLDAMRQIDGDPQTKQGVGLMFPALMFPTHPSEAGWATEAYSDTLSDWTGALLGEDQCASFKNETIGVYLGPEVARAGFKIRSAQGAFWVGSYVKEMTDSVSITAQCLWCQGDIEIELAQPADSVWLRVGWSPSAGSVVLEDSNGGPINVNLDMTATTKVVLRRHYPALPGVAQTEAEFLDISLPGPAIKVIRITGDSEFKFVERVCILDERT